MLMGELSFAPMSCIASHGHPSPVEPISAPAEARRYRLPRRTAGSDLPRQALDALLVELPGTAPGSERIPSVVIGFAARARYLNIPWSTNAKSRPGQTARGHPAPPPLPPSRYAPRRTRRGPPPPRFAPRACTHLNFPGFVIAGPPGPREARPEDKLHVPATHEHRRSPVRLRKFVRSWQQRFHGWPGQQPGHDEI